MDSEDIFVRKDGQPIEFFLMSSVPNEIKQDIIRGNGVIVNQPGPNVYILCSPDSQFISGGCYSTKLITDSLEQKEFQNPEGYALQKNKKITQEEEEVAIKFLLKKRRKNGLHITKDILEEAGQLIDKDWKVVRQMVKQHFDLDSIKNPTFVPIQTLRKFNDLAEISPERDELEKEDVEISNYLDQYAAVADQRYYESAPSDSDGDDSESEEMEKSLIIKYTIKKLQRYSLQPTPVIIHALYVTNGNFNEAKNYLIQGYHNYKDKIWSPEEDRILLGSDEGSLKRLSEQKGEKSVKKRLKFLEGIEN